MSHLKHPPQATKVGNLVRDLRILNAAYETSVEERKALPMEEKRFKWRLLQEEADHYCGAIMRTERAIIVALLAEDGE